MARKLKTFVTNLGFFELAVAAPSMKAALEAWGFGQNAFRNDFAWETDDAKIVAAATAKPGIVLRRAVGTTGAFSEEAELPKSLQGAPPSRGPARSPKTESKSKKPVAAKTSASADRAAVISFEKEKARRDQQRAKEEAAEKRDQAQWKRILKKAEADLERASKHHEDILGEIEEAREKLDAGDSRESARWDAQRQKLQDAVDRARRH